MRVLFEVRSTLELKVALESGENTDRRGHVIRIRESDYLGPFLSGALAPSRFAQAAASDH
jgi:hypothetical protein